MKTYKLFRGLLKASAFATVMFVMQACYGAPQEPFPNYDEEYDQVDDTIQDSIPDIPMGVEAE